MIISLVVVCMMGDFHFEGPAVCGKEVSAATVGLFLTFKQREFFDGFTILATCIDIIDIFEFAA